MLSFWSHQSKAQLWIEEMSLNVLQVHHIISCHLMIETPPCPLFILSPLLKPFYPHSALKCKLTKSMSFYIAHFTDQNARHFKNILREQRRLRGIWNLFPHKSPWVSAGGRCVSCLGTPSCSSRWSTPLGWRKLHSTPDYPHQHVLHLVIGTFMYYK